MTDHDELDALRPDERQVRRARVSGFAAAEEDDFDAPIPRARRRLAARMARIGLPLAAAALIVGFFYWRPAGEEPERPAISVAELLELQASGKVTNPHFVGQTRTGEPVSFRAAEARPDGLDLNHVDLEDITGEIKLEGGRVVTLTAATGRYDRAENRVEGAGGVEIATSDGFRFETERAQARIDEGVAVADTPVRGAGPQGEIRAGRMRLEIGEGEEMRALFEGGVEVTIRQVAESRATGE